MKVYASISGGKDSLAALITHMERGGQCDGAIYCRIMFDDEAMKYECLKLEERRIIEEMYAKGAKPGEIAERVGKCQATIYRELERGKTGETDSRFRQGYSAAVAEARVNRSYRNRGRRKAAQ